MQLGILCFVHHLDSQQRAARKEAAVNLVVQTQSGCVCWSGCGAAESALPAPQLLLCRYAVPSRHGKQAQQILEQHTTQCKKETSKRLETPMLAPSTLLSEGEALHPVIFPLCLCARPAAALSTGGRWTPGAPFLVG